jgi:hypothetical protein
MPALLLAWSELLFEGSVKPSVPNDNGQPILCRELSDEFDLLLPERCFWRPDVRQLVVIHYTISSYVDSMVNPLAKFLREVIHAASVRENSSLHHVT